METSTTALLSATTAVPPSHTFIKLCLLWTALHRGSQIPAGCRGVISENHLREIEANGHDGFSNILDRLDKGEWQGAIGADNVTRRRKMTINGEVVDDGQDDHVRFHYRYTTRSLSVIGVLGGIVLILLVVALSTCIRNRRNILVQDQSSRGHESFARQILIDHIRHLSRGRRGSIGSYDEPPANDVPPAYDEVVKDHEGVVVEEMDAAASLHPPTYVEAMEISHRLEAVEEEEEEGAAAAAAAGSSNIGSSHVVQIEVRYGEDSDAEPSERNIK
jgi:hypothetical protein